MVKTSTDQKEKSVPGANRNTFEDYQNKQLTDKFSGLSGSDYPEKPADLQLINIDAAGRDLKKSGCLHCRKPLARFDDMPLKDAGLCRECAGLWQRLDSIINRHAENKAIEAKREEMLAKWGGSFDGR